MENEEPDAAPGDPREGASPSPAGALYDALSRAAADQALDSRFDWYRDSMHALDDGLTAQIWAPELPGIYVDTSALLKLYKPEHGSDVSRLLERALGEFFGTSAMGVLEAVNGIWHSGAGGSGEVTQADRRTMHGHLLAHLSRRRLAVLPLDIETLSMVPRVAQSHGRIGGRDDIHLATALVLRARRCLHGLTAPFFVTCDGNLKDAAEAEKLRVLDPAAMERSLFDSARETLEKDMAQAGIPVRNADAARRLVEMQVRRVLNSETLIRKLRDPSGGDSTGTGE